MQLTFLKFQPKYSFLSSHWFSLNNKSLYCWLSQILSGLNWPTSGQIFHMWFAHLEERFCWFLPWLAILTWRWKWYLCSIEISGPFWTTVHNNVDGHALHSHYYKNLKSNILSTVQDLRFLRWWQWRMPSSGMLHCAALKRTNVSEECIDSIIRVTRIGMLEATSAVTSNQSMLLTASYC
jgi:hypothetical protein